MPYNLVGVSLQTKYTTKDGPRGPSFAFYETIMSYLPVTAPQVLCLLFYPSIPVSALTNSTTSSIVASSVVALSANFLESS